MASLSSGLSKPREEMSTVAVGTMRPTYHPCSRLWWRTQTQGVAQSTSQPKFTAPTESDGGFAGLMRYVKH